MEITAASIIEEVLDPLMFSDLADEIPTLNFRRVADNAVELDFGLPDRIFLLRVEERGRAYLPKWSIDGGWPISPLSSLRDGERVVS